MQTQLQILTAVVKLFLKRPDQSQGLVQKVLQQSTAENDNPDIRDRAYVYWRLLSSDPTITRNIVLSERPPITSTIHSLPVPLLEQLLRELSTLASVYHKPPASFLGQGRFASDAMQQAAIEEQRQNARENPIAAAAAAAAVSGGLAPQNNVENLLDFDADGAMPASLQKQPPPGGSGLEGLAGTPQRVESPSPAGMNNHASDDLAGIFGNGEPPPAQQQLASIDMMNGFAGLNVGSQTKQAPRAPQVQTNEDLLGDLM